MSFGFRVINTSQNITDNVKSSSRIFTLEEENANLKIKIKQWEEWSKIAVEKNQKLASINEKNAESLKQIKAAATKWDPLVFVARQLKSENPSLFYQIKSKYHADQNNNSITANYNY